MVKPILCLTLSCLLMTTSALAEQNPKYDVKAVQKAVTLSPNLEDGREIYRVCAVCHAPEGWGTRSGSYPQIAGQHSTVIIKQLADILARNRDSPIMFPFAVLEELTPQDLADVAAYLAMQPMTSINDIGPGTDLEHGKKLYEENCTECHGANGEGSREETMPLIQGQHYRYLVRQFEWIRDGKRRNADKEMVQQIQGFSDRDIAAVMDYTSRLKPPAERLKKPDWQNPDFPTFVRSGLPK